MLCPGVISMLPALQTAIAEETSHLVLLAWVWQRHMVGNPTELATPGCSSMTFRAWAVRTGVCQQVNKKGARYHGHLSCLKGKLKAMPGVCVRRVREHSGKAELAFMLFSKYVGRVGPKAWSICSLEIQGIHPRIPSDRIKR